MTSESEILDLVKRAVKDSLELTREAGDNHMALSQQVIAGLSQLVTISDAAADSQADRLLRLMQGVAAIENPT